MSLNKYNSSLTKMGGKYLVIALLVFLKIFLVNTSCRTFSNIEKERRFFFNLFDKSLNLLKLVKLSLQI